MRAVASVVPAAGALLADPATPQLREGARLDELVDPATQLRDGARLDELADLETPQL
jgi:hypothetical protein